MMRIGALALFAAACGQPASGVAPVVTVEPGPVVSASASPRASAAVVALSDAPFRTRLPELGVSIILPPDIVPTFDENRGGYYFRIADAEQGAIELAATAAPKTADEATARWADADGQSEHRVLEHGGGGVEPWWGVTSFEVRVGVAGRRGLHRLKRVSRVHAVLDPGTEKPVTCTMFLEYDVENAARLPSLDEAIGICKSMRPLQ